MNGIFYWIAMLAFLVAGYRQLGWIPVAAAPSPMELLSTAMLKGAEGAVTLAIGLVGVMTLFLGLMKVAEAGGLLVIIARLLRPLLKRLFPEVPADHPAMGAMIFNLAANILGLGNAATPFGIRAMQALESLNPRPGTATNAMVMFLAINTSSISLLPTGVIALRAAAGSLDPAGIVPTTLFATTCSTIMAILTAKLLEKVWPYGEAEAGGEKAAAAPAPSADPETPLPALAEGYPLWLSVTVLVLVVALIPLTIHFGKQVAPWIIPGLMILFLSFGRWRGVRVYETFVDGARDGFQVAIKIIPYLVAILVVVSMFRASGALDWIITPVGSVTALFGLPPEGLTMALLRPLSGSGAYAYVASVLQDPAIGPDSYTGYLVSTIQGSTETTFYVLAVYFGAVQVRRIRHALVAGIVADLAGVMGSVIICSYLYR